MLILKSCKSQFRQGLIEESSHCFYSPHHHHPFPFFAVNAAFSEEQCAALEQLFAQDIEWQHRDGAFYRCSLCDVTEIIPATFQTEILARMREITGLPLVNRVLVTAQRMQPGQVIGIHSDRPLLGYEIARLVVQLNKQWQAEHGGVLELFASPEGEAVFSVNPEYNKAFGFLLHADSYHGVTEVTQPRQTVVFNFWHMANTPELAAHIRSLVCQPAFLGISGSTQSYCLGGRIEFARRGDISCRHSSDCTASLGL